MFAVNWKSSTGLHSMPVITTEWGCWQFTARSDIELQTWMDFTLELFKKYNIGNFWYAGIISNQYPFSIFDSEYGWHQAALDKLTGAQPSTWPKLNQIINGEFLHEVKPWLLTSDDITAEIVNSGAYSGCCMLKVTVPDKVSGGVLFEQMYDKSHTGFVSPHGRTLLHLIDQTSYTVRFIVGTDEGQTGRVQVRLLDADEDSGHPLFASTWVNVTSVGTIHEFTYKHTLSNVSNARLEFDVGSVQQVIYLDKVELQRA